MDKKLMIRAGIGLGLGVVAYFLFKYVAKVIYKPKDTMGKTKAFANADGETKNVGKAGSSFTASYYNPEHKNLDGSLGATWIAYNDNYSIGYWEQGIVKEGTPMFP